MFVLDGAIVFLDLGGTLVELDGRIPKPHQTLLQELGRRAQRVVLVTGQPFDDPQVQQVLSIYGREGTGEFVAYLTRGGLRLAWRSERLERDEAYAVDNCLDDALRQRAEDEVARVLADHNLTPLVPVRCLDEVAIRVNLPPALRPEFVSELQHHLAAIGLADLQVLAEGRTSIFVTRRGVGKRRAVEHELTQSRSSGRESLYFGNEFAEGGNDRDVLGIPGLVAYALGPCDPLPNARCQTIGTSPADLYAALEVSLRGVPTPSPPLPVLCVSLGGTKLGLGALTATGSFLPAPEFHWRRSAAFVSPADAGGSAFCEALAAHIHSFLRARGYDWHHVGVLGVPFPGPHTHGRWQSNNLTAAFADGVPLEDTLRAALSRLAPERQLPSVRVRFDAQCDAGGNFTIPTDG